MIRNADHLMAQAIREVAALYEDGVLPTPANYPYAFPNLLTFDDAPTVVEQKLLVMFLEHRMQTYQGTFHAGPDHALCYGWSEMQRDLTEIKELSAQMRREHTSQVARYLCPLSRFRLVPTSKNVAYSGDSCSRFRPARSLTTMLRPLTLT